QRGDSSRKARSSGRTGGKRTAAPCRSPRRNRRTPRRPKLESPGVRQRATERTTAPLSVGRDTPMTAAAHGRHKKACTTPALGLRTGGTEDRPTAGGGLVALTRDVAGDQALPEAVTTAGRGPEAVGPGAVSCPTNDRALSEGRGTTPVVAIPTATGEIQGAADDLGTHGHLHDRIPA
ncbi:unnamed protein product, partial [Ectocarpus fasciculatus]